MRRIPVTESPAENDKPAQIPLAAEPKSEPSGADVRARRPIRTTTKVCRRISTAFAIWPCAARPISRITRSAPRARKRKRSNTPTARSWSGSSPSWTISSSVSKPRADEGENSPVFSGMSMVLKQLMDFLTEHGLQPIDATGQKFDPNLHEAIAHEPSEQVPRRRRDPPNAPRLSDEGSASSALQRRGFERSIGHIRPIRPGY